jgi:hypothetical protein
MPKGLTYRQLDALDSELLCQGIERVYGHTYPIPEFYDPQYIHAAITQKKLHSIVAMNPAATWSVVCLPCWSAGETAPPMAVP